MAPILPAVPRFGSRIGQVLGQSIGQSIGAGTDSFSDQKIIQGLPENPSTMDLIKAMSRLSPRGHQSIAPAFQEMIREQGAQKQEAQKQEVTQKKSQDKQDNLKQALETIKTQREIVKRGHLGPQFFAPGSPGFNVFLNLEPERLKDRAKYARLGKSLISLSSTIPIRNRQEFETLAESLYDPSLRNEEIEGVLEAMEQIVLGQLPEDARNAYKETSASSPSSKEKKSLASFY